MADTYSQIYVHIVFAVRNRSGCIHPDWQDELYSYVAGIIRNKEQKPLAINGMTDHIHILVGIRPSCNISDLVREIKKSSTAFIKEKRFCVNQFTWQNGFGAFSCGHADLKNVIAYINKQKEHHKDRKFETEYRDFMLANEIDFKEQFLFDWAGG